MTSILQIFILLRLGLGFDPLFSFIFLKNEALLLNLTFTEEFCLFFAIFFFACASNLVMPPYSIFRLAFFCKNYFFLCRAFRLFFSLLAWLLASFSDMKPLETPLLLWLGSWISPFHKVVGIFSSRTIVSELVFWVEFLSRMGFGMKLKLLRQSSL